MKIYPSGECTLSTSKNADSTLMNYIIALPLIQDQTRMLHSPSI